MKNLVNITSRIKLKNSEIKISRLEIENAAQYRNLEMLKDENSKLTRKMFLLEEENRELKKLLDEKDIEITYE